MKRLQGLLLRAAVLVAPQLLVLTPLDAGVPAGADWVARYRVVFDRTVGGVPTAGIEASLRWVGDEAARPVSVEVEMADDGFPAGYGAFVRGFEAVGPAAGPAVDGPADPKAAGQAFAARMISMRAGRYRLPVTGEGFTGFRYTVVMEHDPADWGPGPDEAPYRFDGGAFWTGRALFITAPGSRAEVSFRAPEGERVSASFEPIPDRPGAYAVPSDSRLRDSFVVVGRHAEDRVSVGEAAVTLALGGGLADFMPELKRSVLLFMNASSAVFGGAPPGRILIAGNLGAPPGSLHGGVFASDISFLVDVPLDGGDAGRWRPFLVHEIFHLWNGTAIRFNEQQQYWFSEGATEYYGHLLPVRIGEESAARFLEIIRHKAAEYLAAAGTESLLAAGDTKFLNYALIYQGGALAALVLDLKIRSATANRASLDDVMRVLYRMARERDGRDDQRGSGSLALEEIKETVSAVAGRPIDDFFERHIEGIEVLPLAESLALAGIEMRAEVADLPELNAILGGLLPLSSITAVSEGLEVRRSETRAILPGDIIINVAGSRVRTFDDLRRALRDAVPGARSEITVLRDGREARVTVALEGTEGDDLARAPVASVVLSLASDADPLALGIRGSLLPGLEADEGDAVDAGTRQSTR